MSHKPVISTDTVDLIPRPEAWRPTCAAAERFDIQRARLGPTLGLKKLGCSVTTNRVVNSLADDPTAYPFWDEVAMRYPAAKHWPDGEIDLRGPGF